MDDRDSKIRLALAALVALIAAVGLLGISARITEYGVWFWIITVGLLSSSVIVFVCGYDGKLFLDPGLVLTVGFLFHMVVLGLTVRVPWVDRLPFQIDEVQLVFLLRRQRFVENLAQIGFKVGEVFAEILFCFRLIEWISTQRPILIQWVKDNLS